MLKAWHCGPGARRVAAFHLPGDLVGLEALESKEYRHDVLADENSEVCVIDYHELMAMCETNSRLTHHLIELLSTSLVAYQQLLHITTSLNAEQRICAFLLALAERYSRLGYASDTIVLRMRQSEIGSYLDLTYETVSRVFCQLERQHYLERSGRSYPHIRLLNVAGMRHLVTGTV